MRVTKHMWIATFALQVFAGSAQAQGTSSELAHVLASPVPDSPVAHHRVRSAARRVPLAIGAFVLHFGLWSTIALVNETALGDREWTPITGVSAIMLGAGSLLAPGMAFAVGESAGGDGKLWATLLGSEIGRLVFGFLGSMIGALAQTGTYEKLGAIALGFGLGQAFGSAGGAILGYELSQS